MTTAVLLSGVGVLVAGTLLALWQATVRYALATQMLGATALAAAGVAVLASGETLGAAFTNEFQPSLGLDGLSAFFVVVVCATAVPPPAPPPPPPAPQSARAPPAALFGGLLPAARGGRLPRATSRCSSASGS